MPLVRTGPTPGTCRSVHHVVELQVGGLVERDGELERRRVLGPGHQPDLVRRPCLARGVRWRDAQRDVINHSSTPTAETDKDPRVPSG
jgi:hypothetical protein